MMMKTSLESLFNRRFDSSGDNWKAKCPFHSDGEERTPSFYVHKEEYVAQCFGCGASGYIHVLAARYTGKDAGDCEKLLGITVEEKVRDRLDRARLQPQIKEPTRYSEALLAGWKKEAHKYVLRRGFTRETLQRAESRYDPVLERQVFPWRSPDGALRGATGRTVSDHPAKWQHYWKFDKGDWLYELPFAHGNSGRPQSELRGAENSELLLVQEGANTAGVELGRGTQDGLWTSSQHSVSLPVEPLLVVEGIFDLLWVVQESSYENVVAPVAARLTYEQARQVKERTNHVIIAFDNDDAGIRGSAAAYRQLRDSCIVEFVLWPSEAKDWMDLDSNGISNALRATTGYVGWRNYLRKKGLVGLTDDPRYAKRKEREVRERSSQT